MNFDLIQQDPEPQTLDVVLKANLGRLDRFTVEIDGEEVGEITAADGNTWHWVSGHQCSTASRPTIKDAILECYKHSQTLKHDNTEVTDDLPF